MFVSLSLTLARARRRFFRNSQVVRLGFLIFLLSFIFYLLSFAFPPIFRLGKEFFFGPVNVFSILLPQNEEIKSTAGRTNILILGIGGAEHDGPNLSDTIIIVSVKTKPPDNPKTPSEVTLISVPRDIYLDPLSGKINTAYAQGTEKGSGAGLALAKGAVSQITGLSIHYGIRIDFAAFEKIIDTLGGIDITIKNTLDDYQYPIPGKEADTCGLADNLPEVDYPCRYEHLHFDPGPTHMDGITALKFVRSRHAEGQEGTDFARAKRQQLVLSAVKTKIFSSETFTSPSKIEQIYNLLKSHVDTDINPKEENNFLNLAFKYKNSKFKNVVLGLDLLDNPPIDERGWILVPKGGNWDEVHKYIQSQLN